MKYGLSIALSHCIPTINLQSNQHRRAEARPSQPLRPSHPSQVPGPIAAMTLAGASTLCEPIVRPRTADGLTQEFKSMFVAQLHHIRTIAPQPTERLTSLSLRHY